MIKHIKTYCIAATLFLTTLSAASYAQECTDNILDNTPYDTSLFEPLISDTPRSVVVIASNQEDGTFTLTFLSDDAAIIDHRTNLMWQRCPYPQLHDAFPNTNEGRCFFNDTDRIDIDDFDEDSDFTVSYEDAARIVIETNAMNYLGYNDWRMPNVKELFSIVSSRCTDPALNERIFPNNPVDADNSCYWSSTPDRYDDPITFYHWVVNFKDGTIDRKVGTTLAPPDVCHLRLVRDND